MNWTEIIVLILSSFGSAGVGFLFSKNKYKQEVLSLKADNEGKEIDNLRKAIDVYRSIVEDLKKTVDSQQLEIFELKEKILSLERKSI